MSPEPQAEFDAQRTAEALQFAAVARQANELRSEVARLRAALAEKDVEIGRAARPPRPDGTMDAPAALRGALAPELVAGDGPFGVPLRGGRRRLSSATESDLPVPPLGKTARRWPSLLVATALLSGLVMGAGLMRRYDDERLRNADILARGLAEQLEKLKAGAAPRP